MNDRVAAERMSDPSRVANRQRIRPFRKNPCMLLGAGRRTVNTLAKAGKIGRNRMLTACVERSRETFKVGARHPEAVNEDDIASAAGGAVSDPVRPSRYSPREGRVGCTLDIVHFIEKRQQRFVERARVLP